MAVLIPHTNVRQMGIVSCQRLDDESLAAWPRTCYLSRSSHHTIGQLERFTNVGKYRHVSVKLSYTFILYFAKTVDFYLNIAPVLFSTARLFARMRGWSGESQSVSVYLVNTFTLGLLMLRFSQVTCIAACQLDRWGMPATEVGEIWHREDRERFIWG